MRGEAVGKAAAAAVTETVIGTLAPLGVAEEGEIVQLASAGASAQANETAVAKPFTGETSRL